MSFKKVYGLGLLLALLLLKAAPAYSKIDFTQACPDSVSCLGVDLHWTSSINQDLASIQGAGFKIVRTDMFWNWVEYKKGIYDFSGFETLVGTMTSLNLRPMFILDYNNNFYPNVDTPAGRAAFVSFARAAAHDFRGKHVIWELWNEANTSHFWPNPNPTNYMLLAKAVIPVIRAEDPTAIIIGPALLPKQPPTDSSVQMTDHDFLAPCFQQGFFSLFDALSVHAYSASPEVVTTEYNILRQLEISGGSSNFPIIDSESGYSSVSNNFTPPMQADYVMRSFLMNILDGVPMGIWYDWKDDSLDPTVGEHDGIVNADLTPKPAYKAMTTLTQALKGYKFVKRMPTSASTDYVLLFQGAGGYKVAAWTTQGPHHIQITQQVVLDLSSTPQFTSVKL